jgi:hypothetical protein
MGRLLPRQRLALAVFIAFTVGTIGAAVAGPENSGNPSVTLDIAPGDGDGLPSPASIMVTGIGFGAGISGDILECSVQPGSGLDVCSDPIGRFTTTGSGNFSATVSVTRVFTATFPVNTAVDCAVTACRVEAVSDSGSFQSAHHISFAGTTTSTSASTTSTSSTSTSTTSTTTPTTKSTSTSSTTTSAPATTTTTPGSRCAQLQAARTAFNAQIDANEAAANQSLPADQRAGAQARLEAARSSGNAQFAQALAGSNCG